MAFTLTWAEVVKVAPDLSTLTVDQQNAVLADTDTQLAEAQIGATKYGLACKYLAAHLGTILKRGATGSAGAVASESVGSVSVSYAVAPMTNEALGSTPYGVLYLGVIRQLQYRVGAVL